MQRENAKERIEQACLELLKTMSLESLRTQELIERAGVSRSTFYRLYQDKYEVANGIYKKQTEKIIQDMPSLKDWKEWSYILHSYMREHRQFFRNIASYRGQNSFGEFLCQYFTSNVLRLRANKEEELTEDQRYAVRAFSLIGAQSTVDWILNDFKPDDETLIRRNEACIPECIRHLYE